MATTRHVPSTGLSLAVTEHSPPGPGKETLVLVHGYPDRSRMWEALVAELPLDELHVVAYDVRGAGDSEVPTSVAGYRSELLVDDLVAVLDAVLPAGGRAHLVGHDWGSVQLWDAVAAERHDPRLHGRIASFTSVSGPPLDHAAWLMRHPRGRRLSLLRQAAHSWYVLAFQVPALPEALWRRGGRWLRRAATWREGTDHWGPEVADDGANGVNLYRANVPRRTLRPRRLEVGVPTLVVHPSRDRFLTGALNAELGRCCTDLREVEVDAGHWLPRTSPRLLAGLVLEHVHRCR